MGHGAWRWVRGSRVHNFPTYSPAGATPFDFVVVYSGDKLHIENEVCCPRLPCLAFFLELGLYSMIGRVWD